MVWVVSHVDYMAALWKVDVMGSGLVAGGLRGAVKGRNKSELETMLRRWHWEDLATEDGYGVREKETEEMRATWLFLAWEEEGSFIGGARWGSFQAGCIGGALWLPRSPPTLRYSPLLHRWNLLHGSQLYSLLSPQPLLVQAPPVRGLVLPSDTENPIHSTPDSYSDSSPRPPHNLYYHSSS